MSFYKRIKNSEYLDLSIAKSRPLFYMCFTLVLSVLFWSNPSDSSAQCKAVGGVKPTHSTKKIILYIENDFASELRQATPAGGVNDAGLTEQQVRSAIMQMAEIWNLQTRAVALVYGGSVSHDVMSDFCNSVPVQPNHQAIFVNFKNTIRPGSNGNVLMSVIDPGDKFLIAYRTARGHNFLLQWVEMLEGEVNVEDRQITLPSKSDELIDEIQQQRRSNCTTSYNGFTSPFDSFIRPWGHKICGGSIDPIQEPLISNGVDR